MSPPRRAYDAAASRRALLDAASTIFDERGYDRTTLRHIGDRAKVDPALVVRYFGGKEGLYLSVLDDEDHAMPMSLDPAPRAVVELLLERWEGKSMSPVKQALVKDDVSPMVQQRANEVLHRRVLRPLVGELHRRGIADAELRADMLIACVLGVSVARRGQMLGRLASSSLTEVQQLLGELAESLVQSD